MLIKIKISLFHKAQEFKLILPPHPPRFIIKTMAHPIPKVLWTILGGGAEEETVEITGLHRQQTLAFLSFVPPSPVTSGLSGLLTSGVGQHDISKS